MRTGDQDVTLESLRAYYRVIEIQPLCFSSLLMMHLCLLRDGITPPRKVRHGHSHHRGAEAFTHPPPPTYLFYKDAAFCLIMGLVHNHCLLAACQAARLARSQAAEGAQEVFAHHPQPLPLAHGAEHSLTLSVSQICTDSRQTVNTFSSYYCLCLRATPTDPSNCACFLMRTRTQASVFKRVSDALPSFKNRRFGSRRQTPSSNFCLANTVIVDSSCITKPSFSLLIGTNV